MLDIVVHYINIIKMDIVNPDDDLFVCFKYFINDIWLYILIIVI